MEGSVQSVSTPRTRIALIEENVVMVAERQEGVIARRQIRECGMSDATVARWVERGRLHRRHPGVYALGHRRISERGELIAGLLYAGPGAALAGLSATAWWEITKSMPRVIEVATAHRRRSVPGVKVSFRPGVERVKHRGLPVTPLPRALLDLARLVPRRTLRRALSEADYLGLLNPEAVVAMCGPGRAGSKGSAGHSTTTSPCWPIPAMNWKSGS